MEFPKPIEFLLLLSAAIAAASPPPELDTTIHQLPDRRVIIERAPGIILPDPPEPVARPVPEPESAEQFAERTAKWHAHRASNPAIYAGATVYSTDGSTITHVTNWRVNNGPMVSFWSSADFSLLAYPGGFTHAAPEGKVNYSMLMFCSHHDVAMWDDFKRRRALEVEVRQFPEFPDGPASWILDESKTDTNPDAATVRAITHIHEHHNENLASLKQTYAKREIELAARRAELEANPLQPRDIHLRVSRLDPAQAAAWHNHAVAASTGRREARAHDGGAE